MTWRLKKPSYHRKQRLGFEFLEQRKVLSGLLTGDADHDGIVAFSDFQLVSANFGKSSAVSQEGDLSGDGRVSFEDFLILSANYGHVNPLAVVESDGVTLVSESGATDTFEVVLTVAPDVDTTVNIASTDAGEATVGRSSVTFTPDNWSVPQQVRVTGQDDDLFDGTQSTPIVLAIDVGDSRFHGSTLEVVAKTANDESLHIQPGDILAASLDPLSSFTGDEFVNYGRTVLGEAPPPGNSRLQGWVNIAFAPFTPEMEALLPTPLSPFANPVHYTVRHYGEGTNELIQFGSGATYLQNNVRVSSNLNDSTLVNPAANQGILDLNSGEVLFANIDANLRLDTAQKVNNFNRFPASFNMTFPSPQLPFEFALQLAQLNPRLHVLTDRDEILAYLEPEKRTPSVDDAKIFALSLFKWDETTGDIIGYEFHGETIVPQFLAQDLVASGFLPFPPFAFGPEGEAYFARPSGFSRSPDQILVDYLDANPNVGIEVPLELPNAAYLHPHLDLVTKEFEKVAPNSAQSPASLPEPLGGLAVAAAAGRLYALGGLEPSGADNHELYRYDPAINTWTPVTPIGNTPAVSYAAAAGVGGSVFVAGGQSSGGSVVHGELHRYDVAANTWQSLAAMPVPVHSAAVSSDQEQIFVIGGTKSDGALSRALQIYDVATGSWRLGAPLPEGRSAAAAALAYSRLYVMGGTVSDSGEATNDMLIYDTREDRWQEAAPLREPVVYASAGFIDDQIALLGGRSSVGGPSTNHHQALDLTATSWEKAGRDPVAAAGSGHAVLDDRLYMVGGFIEQGVESVLPGPGQVLETVRSKSARGPWFVSEDRPLIHPLSLVNAADISPRLGTASRAVILGHGLSADPTQIQVALEGQPVGVLFSETPTDSDTGQLLEDRIYVQLPPIPLAAGKLFMELSVSVNGVASSTRIQPIGGNAPSLYIYDYLSDDRAFLDDAVAFAHDASGNLNFAAQPSRPGDIITLYATGLNPLTPSTDVTAAVDGLDARVVSVVPEGPGITLVNVEVPTGVRPGTNVVVEITSAGVRSNRAAIAVFPAEDVPFPSDPLNALIGRQFVAGLIPLDLTPAPSSLIIAPTGETTILGQRIEGSLTETFQSDDIYEVFQPAKGRIIHQWNFEFGGEQAESFFIEAHGASSEEVFWVSSSTDGGVVFRTRLPVSKVEDDDLAQFFEFNEPIGDRLSILIVDSRTDLDNSTLFVDQIGVILKPRSGMTAPAST